MLKTCLGGWSRVGQYLLLLYVWLGVCRIYASEEIAYPFYPRDIIDQPWRVTSLVEEGGLFNKYITCVDFEKNGSAWISTSDGLYRYDGYTWKWYGIADGLPSSFVRCVLVARDGKIWFGTDRGAGYLRDGRFIRLDVSENELGASVRRIVEEPDGGLWFCCDQWPDASTRGGLSYFYQGKWIRYGGSEEGFSSHVYHFFRDSQGQRYATTLNGLFQLQGDRWVNPMIEDGIRDFNSVYMMAEGQSAELIASNSDTLFIRQKGHWRRQSLPSPYQHTFICSTRDGRILSYGHSGTDRQAFFEWSGDRFVQVSSSCVPLSHSISLVREAPDGSIWCCGFNTLLRWERKSAEWSEYENLPPPQFTDNQRRIWFTARNLAVRYDGIQWERVMGFPSFSAIDGRGNVWGWDSKQLKCWVGKEVYSYQKEETGVSRISGLVAGASKGMWIYGTDPEDRFCLSFFDNERWLQHSLPDIQPCHIRSYCPDFGSGIWLLISDPIKNDLQVVKVENGRRMKTIPFDLGCHAYDNPSLWIDWEGHLWLYSRFGLYFLSWPESENWHRIEPLPGKNLIGGVVRPGDIWFGADGIIGGKGGLLHIRDGISETYECNVRSYGIRSPDGSAYFGGEGRFFRISPGVGSKPVSITLPLPGLVERVVKDCLNRYWVGIGERVICWTPDGVPPDTKIAEMESKLHQGQNLRPSFSAVERFHTRNERKTFRYSWRIDSGFWSQFNSSPMALIPMRNVSPGAHCLQVRARDEGGDEDLTPAEFPFFVQSIPIQERAWFKPVVLSVVLSIFLLAIAALAARRRLAIHLQNLEAIVGERTAALRENEERFRSLVDASSDLIWESNENLVYTYVSSKVKDILGYNPEEVIGKYYFDFMMPAERVRITEFVEEYRNPPQSFYCRENVILHKNGGEVVLESSGVPIFDAQGNFRGFRGVDRDITSRKKEEQEKRQLEEHLFQAQKMEAIGQLAGGVAHDFNNLLTVIIGNLELALLRASDEVRVFLNHTKQATVRATQLVKQLLAFSRKSPIELKTIQIDGLIHEFYSLVRETIDRRIDIVLKMAKELPPVNADVSQLNSVLMNLCINARDAILEVIQQEDELDWQNKRFAIEIIVQSICIDREMCNKNALFREGRFVTLCVSDNGIGMKRETLDRIFEPFYTTKGINRGTGLGLSNVYGIVDQHGGWITVESEPGQGSSFTIYLPVSDDIPDSPEQDNPVELQGGDETVLFIDDEEMICHLNQTVLSELGYTVLAAADGVEGLEIYYRNRDRIDLIVIDFSMPGLSGGEVLQRIFADNPQMKVIVSSGYVDDRKVQSLEKLGVSGFLNKPFRQEALVRKVREVLSAGL